MPYGAAITAIFTVFLCCWAFNMARDPKQWRLWWMNLLGIVDLTSSREQRRRQETQISLVAWFLCVLCLAVGASCIYWTAVEWQEFRRPKTHFEQDQEYTRRQAEEVQSRKPFRKLQ